MDWATRYDKHEFNRAHRLVGRTLTPCDRCGVLKVELDGRESYLMRDEKGEVAYRAVEPACIVKPKPNPLPRKALGADKELAREDAEEIW